MSHRLDYTERTVNTKEQRSLKNTKNREVRKTQKICSMKQTEKS